MKKNFYYLLLIFLNIGFSQDPAALRDSIIKYEFINPTKAIEFGLQFTEITIDRKPIALYQQTYGLIGQILFETGLDASALEYFNLSIKTYQSLPDSQKKFPKIDFPPWIILNIGSLYLRNKEYDKSEEKYNEAKALFEKIEDQEVKFNGLNTTQSNIGLLAELKGNLDFAEEIYFNVYQRRLTKSKPEDILYSLAQLLSIEIRNNDFTVAKNRLSEIDQFYMSIEDSLKTKGSISTRNYGYAYLVFAAYFQSIKKYEEAIEYLEKSKKIVADFPDELNALGSRFAECYLGANDLEKAEAVAKENLSIPNLNPKEKKYNYKVLENVYKKKKFDAELLKIKDSLLLLSASNISTEIMNKLNGLDLSIKLSESTKRINENKIRYNSYLFILFLLVVILLFSLSILRANNKFQKEKSLRLELTNKQIQSEINLKNRELTSKVNFISQRNEYLKNLKKKASSNGQKEQITVFKLKKELDLIINSEKTYQEFDEMFVTVYPDFFKKLNERYKLSKTDLRLAAYIKMNHTNDEIARISGVSKRTVETQRYRLSKKLDLPPNQDLNSFIITL